MVLLPKVSGSIRFYRSVESAGVGDFPFNLLLDFLFLKLVLGKGLEMVLIPEYLEWIRGHTTTERDNLVDTSLKCICIFPEAVLSSPEMVLLPEGLVSIQACSTNESSVGSKHFLDMYYAFPSVMFLDGAEKVLPEGVKSIWACGTAESDVLRGDIFNGIVNILW